MSPLEQKIIQFLVDYGDEAGDYYVDVSDSIFELIASIITKQDEWQVPFADGSNWFYGVNWASHQQLAGMPTEIGGVQWDGTLRCKKIGFGIYRQSKSFGIEHARNFWVFGPGFFG